MTHLARRLPPGSHGIPADVVVRNQRERLVAAMAEACAEKGYASTSVADVAKRAGVSLVTFYKQFADKRDCMLVAHEELLGRLLEGVEHRDAAVEALSKRLQAGGPDADPSPPSFGWIAVAGMLALIGRLVVAGEAARLPELEDELVATVLFCAVMTERPSFPFSHQIHV